jgi:hypothetical protein
MPSDSPSDKETRVWPRIRDVFLGLIVATGAATAYTFFGTTLLSFLQKIDFIYGIVVGAVLGSIVTILLSPYIISDTNVERPTDVTVNNVDEKISIVSFFWKAFKGLTIVFGLLFIGAVVFMLFGNLILSTGGLLSMALFLNWFSSRDYSEIGLREWLIDYIKATGFFYIFALSGMGIGMYIFQKIGLADSFLFAASGVFALTFTCGSALHLFDRLMKGKS